MNILEAEPVNLRSSGTRLQRIAAAVVLAGFSIFYFADILLRASEKYFWYDELLTVYISRLSMGGIWRVPQAGIDSNTPLPYLLTKASNAIFGGGLIGARMPAILGFWILCVCLFRFVNKRAGILGGLIAMLLPVFTGAFYYAYDARAYGVVLGFCGLALVFWQMSVEEPHRKRWLWCYALSVFAAFLTHCYAITITLPFAIAEIVHDVRSRHISFKRWLALIVPAIVACITYIPLLEGFHGISKGTGLVDLAPPVWPQVREFYSFLLGPCMLIALIALVLVAVRCINAIRGAGGIFSASTAVLIPEIALALSFAALPALGVAMGKVTHSVFIYRYFLSALVAVCILTGLAAAAGKPSNRIAVALAAVLVCSAGWNISALVWHRLHGVPENLSEPSSGFSMNCSLAGPLDRYSLLVSQARAHKDQPIAILWPIDYLYLVTYAPDLVNQMYYVQWDKRDFFYYVYERFQRWSPVRYNIATQQEFLRLSPKFMLYGQKSALADTMARDTKIEIAWLKTSNEHFLAEAQNEAYARH